MSKTVTRPTWENQIRANGDHTVTKMQNSGRKEKTIAHKKIQSPLSDWIL